MNASVVPQSEVHPVMGHPERSRFSGGAKDLLASNGCEGDPSARWKNAGLRDDAQVRLTFKLRHRQRFIPREIL